MTDEEWLAERFEGNRARLRAMALRMLGSASDADDAVQEAWLRAARAGADDVANLDGWLTTITARVCLDLLRSRRARREETAGGADADFEPDLAAWPGVGPADLGGPEQEAVLADSVGLALQVVLDRLAPAERVAFVLHDMFGIPFGEIAQITGRSSDGARQLASRARRRVRGAAGQDAAGQDAEPGPSGRPAGGPAQARRLARQRAVAEAFIAASRAGDLEALLAVLDPDVVLHADAAAAPTGKPAVLQGATAVAHGARLAAGRSRESFLALVDGVPGIVYAPGGQVATVLAFRYREDRISGIEVIAEPARLDALELALLG
ncbi:MAG TPA: sigma-70 family RNA polymerase sigma factor [Trebonia sp.]|nr:sigma-70 family RNA polymerase sigma factor [Trebonia sp.]